MLLANIQICQNMCTDSSHDGRRQGKTNDKKSRCKGYAQLTWPVCEGRSNDCVCVALFWISLLWQWHDGRGAKDEGCSKRGLEFVKDTLDRYVRIYIL
jgi:hypothetical protein